MSCEKTRHRHKLQIQQFERLLIPEGGLDKAELQTAAGLFCEGLRKRRTAR